MSTAPPARTTARPISPPLLPSVRDASSATSAERWISTTSCRQRREPPPRRRADPAGPRSPRQRRFRKPAHRHRRATRPRSRFGRCCAARASCRRRSGRTGNPERCSEFSVANEPSEFVCRQTRLTVSRKIRALDLERETGVEPATLSLGMRSVESAAHVRGWQPSTAQMTDGHSRVHDSASL